MADFVRGELLVQLREARHLSQAEAAHRIGVSEKALRTWEKGGGIRWYNAEKLGAFYDRDPHDLVAHESDEPIPLARALSDRDRLDAIEQSLHHITSAIEELLRRER